MLDGPPPEAITVTAPRPPLRTAAPAVLLDGRALDERAPRLLADVFRTLPGVSMRTNSRGEAVLRIRGSEERQAAVFLDGAPLSVPWDGRVDLGMLPPGLIAGIDVVRSAAPIEYGANAVAGVADLASARATDEGTRTSVAVEGGTLGYRSLSTVLLRRAGQASYTLAAGHVERDAEALADRDATPFSQPDAGGRLNTDLATTSLFAAAETVLGGATLRAALLHVDAEKGIAPESHLDPARDAPRYWRYPDWALTQLTVAGDAPLGATRLRVVAWRQWFGQTIDAYRTAEYSSLGSREVDDDDTLGARATLGWHGARLGWRLSATTQTSTHEQVDTAFGAAGAATPGPLLRYRQRVASVGAEFDWRPSAGFGTTLGVARDSVATPLSGDKPPQPDDAAWAWSAIARWDTGGSWALTASTGERTRFATARELFGEALGRFLPNPGLGPERAWISEVAAEYRGESLSLTVTPYFARGEETLGQRIVTVAGRNLRQRHNLPGTQAWGADLAARWRWTPALEVELGAALLRATADSPNGLPGRQLPQRPDREYLAALTWRAVGGGWLRGTLRHTGSGVDIGPGVDFVRLPAGTEFGLRLEWPVAVVGPGRLWLTAAADNLTDAVVYPQAGLPLAGRTLRLGLRLR